MGKKETEVSVADIIDLVLAEKPSLYCDRSYEPHIRIQGDLFDRPWPVDSPRIKAWIAELCHGEKKYPKPSVVAQVMTVLAGKAWKNKQRVDDMAVLNVLENEPVVEAVLVLMGGKPRVEKLARGLLTDLNVVASTNQMNVWSPRWPKSASALTRRLRQYEAVLQELGITVATEHKKYGTFVTLTKLESDGDDEGVTPSPKPSPENSLPGNGLPPGDDMIERNYPKLIGDIRQQKEENNEQN